MSRSYIECEFVRGLQHGIDLVVSNFVWCHTRSIRTSSPCGLNFLVLLLKWDWSFHRMKHGEYTMRSLPNTVLNDSCPKTSDCYRCWQVATQHGHGKELRTFREGLGARTGLYLARNSIAPDSLVRTILVLNRSRRSTGWSSKDWRSSPFSSQSVIT